MVFALREEMLPAAAVAELSSQFYLRQIGLRLGKIS
jgi:hypothetical protein